MRMLFPEDMRVSRRLTMQLKICFNQACCLLIQIVKGKAVRAPGLDEGWISTQQEVGENLKQREFGIYLLNPQKLAHLVDFQKDVLFVGRENEIEAAKQE